MPDTDTLEFKEFKEAVNYGESVMDNPNSTDAQKVQPYMQWRKLLKDIWQQI